MAEIVTTIGLSAALLYILIQSAVWLLHGRRAGPHERALLIRWAAYSGLLLAAVSAWAVTGIATFLYGAAFWRGVYVGGNVVMWLGYVPALVWAVRKSGQQQASARAADFGPVA